MNLDEITGEVVDAAIKVHRELGPGLLETVYEWFSRQNYPVEEFNWNAKRQFHSSLMECVLMKHFVSICW